MHTRIITGLYVVFIVPRGCGRVAQPGRAGARSSPVRRHAALRTPGRDTPLIQLASAESEMEEQPSDPNLARKNCTNQRNNSIAWHADIDHSQLAGR